MSILVGNKSKIVVQGITGSEGTFHSHQMIEYGTNIVAGVTPGKGGQEHLGKPVFNSVKEAVDKVEPNASIIFVPAKFCKDSILEAAEAGIKLIICITEGVPTLDMLDVKKQTSFKWNDPKIRFKWPIKNPILSTRDKRTKKFTLYKFSCKIFFKK